MYNDLKMHEVKNSVAAGQYICTYQHNKNMIIL